VLVANSQPSLAAQWTARSAAEVSAASKKAAPGDVIEMVEGEWVNQVVQLQGQGRQGAPITLRAKTPGKVVLTGSSRVEVSGRWLVVDGLRFERGGLRNGEAVVRFGSRRGDTTEDSRLTNTAIIGYNPADPKIRYYWVELTGQRIRVDHNLFQGQNHSGPTILVQRETPDANQHLIEYNHFLDRAPGSGNGFESIRLGSSKQAQSDSASVVQYNLLERANGEIEAISVKSGGNTIRYNTLRDTLGSITLRNGSGNKVIGNVFIGGRLSGALGIRVMGAGHTISDNVLQEVDAKNGAISLNCGHANAAERDAANAPVVDVVVERNTIIGIQGPAINAAVGCGTLGRTMKPRGLSISDNIVSGEKTRLIEGEDGNDRWTVRNNRTVPAADARAARSSAGLIEIGAANSKGPTVKPLTTQDVGPEWLHGARGPVPKTMR
jgi:poly(beta-D-mannuronate) lyase